MPITDDLRFIHGSSPITGLPDVNRELYFAILMNSARTYRVKDDFTTEPEPTYQNKRLGMKLER